MNTTIVAAAANNGLLAYAFNTDPDPLQASPQQGNPAYGALTIVVSNNTMQAIYCNKITFYLPVGPGNLAQYLTDDATNALAAASPSDQWRIANNKDGSFTATPIKPEYNRITTDGLVFQLYNIQVNQQPGVFTVSLSEESSTDNTNFSKKDNSYTQAKFPYGFFLHDFAPSAPLVPDGQPVTLKWIASDLALYRILYDDQQVDVTNVRSWTSPPLHHTTSFLLQATVQEQGETVHAHLSTTVTVANPEVVCTSLRVLNDATILGAIHGMGIVPSGGIMMFSGDVNANFDGQGTGKTGTPYQGWQLCNGQNNSPNLLDRFIAVAGGSYKIGDKGGADTVALTVDQLPSHNHGGNTGGTDLSLSYKGVASDSYGSDSGIQVQLPVYPPPNSFDAHHTTISNPIQILPANHQHGIGAQGGGQAHENRPAFYALAFIMKL